jgi:transcriptional regulator GlxA family with amidase domain
MAITADVYTKIVTAKMYMDKNFQEAIGLEQISRQALISRFHFHRLFTSIYNQTPHRYLTLKRIDHARQLLHDELLSVQEVCNSVGFESMGSFSVLFKKEIGFAPLYYRRMASVRKKLARQEPRIFIPSCFANAFG